MAAQRSIISRWIIDLTGEAEAAAKQAQVCLLSAGSLAVEALIDAARQADEQQQVKLLMVLTEIDDPRCFDFLLEMLSSPNIIVGDLAARGLARYGGKGVDALLHHLPISLNFVQLSIITALQKIGDRRAVQPLMTFLKTTTSPIQRYTAIQALGVLGDPQAEDLIRTFQDDPDHHVKQRVQTALALIETKKKGGTHHVIER